MMNQNLTILVVWMLTATAPAADVTLYDESDEWASAVGNDFTTIDFTEGDNFTFIDDDYALQGVTFSSNAHYWNTTGFLNDDWGMRAVGGAWVNFDSPQRWLAADHPGGMWVDLHRDGQLFYSSPLLGGAGNGFFSGLISSRPFDAAYIYRPEPHANKIYIDDLHFGIPAPGALGLLALAGLVRRRKRGAA